MGMLTDFFVASARDAKRYEKLCAADTERAEAALRSFERVEHQGLTGLELGALWAIIAREPFSQPRFSLKMGPMTEESEGILEEFPAEFTQFLIKLEGRGIATLAEAWSKVEGVAHKPEELAPILADLQRLASSSASIRKPLYIWCSI